MGAYVHGVTLGVPCVYYAMKVEWRTRRESLHAKRAKRRGGGGGMGDGGEEEEAAKVERCARDVCV